MKRKLLSLALISLTIFGTSCQKEDLTSVPGSRDRSGMNARGGGLFSAESCGTNLAPAKLIIEKDGKNNSFITDEGNILIGTTMGEIGTEDYVWAEVKPAPGYVLKTLDIWVGPKASAPVNNSGNAQVGNFQVHYNNIPNATLFMAKVPKSMITCGPDMIVIIRSTVFKHNTEVSWAETPASLSVVPGGKTKYVPYTPCFCQN